MKPMMPKNIPAQLDPQPAPQMNAQPMAPVAPAAQSANAPMRGTHNPDNMLPAAAFHGKRR